MTYTALFQITQDKVEGKARDGEGPRRLAVPPFPQL